MAIPGTSMVRDNATGSVLASSQDPACFTIPAPVPTGSGGGYAPDWGVVAPGGLTTDIYWAAQPAAVQQLRNMPTGVARDQLALQLSNAGYTIDYDIMVAGADPVATMVERGQYSTSAGYTPSANQPGTQTGWGGGTGPAPAGSIATDTVAADYKPWTGILSFLNPTPPAGSPPGGLPANLPGGQTMTPAGTFPRSVRMVNLTRGGSSFQVGDNYRLTVQGDPNKPVAGSATQNGKSLGSSQQYGSTDASGSFVLDGGMTADTVGSWAEQWSVGGVPVGSLSFQVAAAPVSGSRTTSSGDNSTLATVALPSSLDFLTNPVSLFGFNVPVWLLAAGGIGAVVLFSGGKRR